MQEQNASAQHWAMQPPPGFAAPTTAGQLNPQPSATAQPHTKLISAGSEIESKLIATKFHTQIKKFFYNYHIARYIECLYCRSISM